MSTMLTLTQQLEVSLSMMLRKAFAPPRNELLASVSLRLSSSLFGMQVSKALVYLTLSFYWIESKRGEETPAPTSYKQDDKAVRPLRYDNIHMGTDLKTTVKEINLTPGPGHYIRVDEQYPRTFHHKT